MILKAVLVSAVREEGNRIKRINLFNIGNIVLYADYRFYVQPIEYYGKSNF